MPRQGAAGESRYRMSHEGQASVRTGLPGMYILKEGVNFQIYRPSWDATRTVFRPFPGLNPLQPRLENGEPNWDPFRLSEEDRDFGDWIRRYDMAMSFGEPGITFITKDPCEHDVDNQQNPVHMLVRAITQAVKSGQGEQSWNPFIFSAAGRSAPLSLPRDGYVMQGILMEHKSKPQTPPRGCLMDHQPVLLLMSQSAGQTLIEKLDERDPEGNLIWGDITDLNAGMFVQFHQAGTQRAPGSSSQTGQSMVGAAASGRGGEGVTNRYEVELLTEYNGISPTYAELPAVAAAHVKPWNNVMRIPTIAEQIRLISHAGIPASAVVYALGDMYGELIPQHVYDQLQSQKAKSVNVPFAAANPMQPAAQSQAVNPMTAAPAVAPAAAPPPVTAAIAQPGSTVPAAATASMTAITQPAHADPSRMRNTQAALAAARARVAAKTSA